MRCLLSKRNESNFHIGKCWTIFRKILTTSRLGELGRIYLGKVFECHSLGMIHPLVMTNIAIEHDHIVDIPIKNIQKWWFSLGIFHILGWFPAIWWGLWCRLAVVQRLRETLQWGEDQEPGEALQILRANCRPNGKQQQFQFASGCLPIIFLYHL